jgi:predicted ribosomally synthesized peptide with nif11-like leader
MTENDLRAFIERMKTDEAFATRVLAVEGAEERQSFIRGEGYDCGADESAAQGGMLAEEELSSVSAGVIPPHGCVIGPGSVGYSPA